MLISQTPSDTCLVIKRKFSATPKRLFEAWTDAKQLKAWFGPQDDSMETTLAETDPKVGGSYRIEIVDNNGEKPYTNINVGTYQVIEPYTKLVFTWQWISQKQPEETLVTIEFNDCGDQTELVITHDRFGDIATRDHHNHGWKACFESLEKHITA